MAYNHVYSNNNDDYKYARMLAATVQQGAGFINGLRALSAEMTQMIDGADYTRIETLFKIQTGFGAAAIGEINSLLAKLDTDSSVTNVKAAYAQLLAKFG